MRKWVITMSSCWTLKEFKLRKLSLSFKGGDGVVFKSDYRLVLF